MSLRSSLYRIRSAWFDPAISSDAALLSELEKIPRRLRDPWLRKILLIGFYSRIDKIHPSRAVPPLLYRTPPSYLSRGGGVRVSLRLLSVGDREGEEILRLTKNRHVGGLLLRNLLLVGFRRERLFSEMFLKGKEDSSLPEKSESKEVVLPNDRGEEERREDEDGSPLNFKGLM